jgi:hypothetical protein
MARLVGTGQVEFFGAPSARFRGSGNPRLFGATGLPAQPGPGNRSSSEPRAPSLIGVRQTALFGGPRAEPHRGQADGTLRRAARRASPGPGQRSSSERRQPVPGQGSLTSMGSGLRSSSERRASAPSGWVPRPTGQGCGTPRSPAPRLLEPAHRHSSERRAAGSNQGSLLFGARISRGQANGAPRSPARRASPGPGQRSSSERRQPVPPGQGHRPSSEERQPRLTRGRVSRSHRGQAGGTLRRVVRRASPGHGNRSSSEPRAPHPAETGITHLIGKPVPRTPRGERRSATRG